MALSPRRKKTDEKPVVKTRRSVSSKPALVRKSTLRSPKKAPVLERKEKARLEAEIVSMGEAPVQLPPAPQLYVQPQRELPDDYGDNQIYLLVRDPYWIYAYWEIQKEHQEKMLDRKSTL